MELGPEEIGDDVPMHLFNRPFSIDLDEIIVPVAAIPIDGRDHILSIPGDTSSDTLDGVIGSSLLLRSLKEMLLGPFFAHLEVDDRGLLTLEEFECDIEILRFIQGTRRTVDNEVLGAGEILHHHIRPHPHRKEIGAALTVLDHVLRYCGGIGIAAHEVAEILTDLHVEYGSVDILTFKILGEKVYLCTLTTTGHADEDEGEFFRTAIHVLSIA